MTEQSTESTSVMLVRTHSSTPFDPDNLRKNKHLRSEAGIKAEELASRLVNQGEGRRIS